MKKYEIMKKSMVILLSIIMGTQASLGNIVAIAKDDHAPKNETEEVEKEVPKEEPTERGAKDITNEFDLLDIQVTQLRYVENEKENTYLNDDGNITLDYNESLPTEGWFLDYEIQLKKGSMRNDTFTFTLPSSILSFDETIDEQTKEIKPVDVKDKDGNVIGSYENKDGKIVVTMDKISDTFRESTFLLSLPLTLKKDAFEKEKSTEVRLILQQKETIEHAVNVVFKASEEKKEESAPTLEETPESKQAKAVVPGENTKVSMMVEWLDLDDSKRPNLISNNLIEITYAIDNAEDVVLSNSTKGNLGLSEMPTITNTKDGLGVGFEQFTCELPKTIKVDGVDKQVTYKMNQKVDNADWGLYLPHIAKDGSHWINTITTSFDFYLDLKQGDVELGHKDNYKDFLSSLMLSSQESVEMGTLDGYKLDVDKTNPNNPFIKVTGLPLFNDQKVEEIYSVKATSDKVLENKDTTSSDFGDYYEPIYRNEDSPNFGTNTTAIHHLGTLRLILTGTSTYKMTKEWLDEFVAGTEEDKNKNRPNAELFLWRYTYHKNIDNEDYKQSAQVKDAHGANYQATISKLEDTQEITIGNDLPKYDPEGFPYVYFTRESLVLQMDDEGQKIDYEQVYGRVKEGNEIVDDALPNGYVGVNKRESSDKSIYNNGVLSNRRKGIIDLSQKKTWKASAHQNQLEHVIVTLTMQIRAKDSNEEWENTKTTRELTGFIAEEMTKEVEVSTDAFNEFGQPLEYRWVESKVEELIDGERVECELEGINDEQGNPTDRKKFTLRHNVSDSKIDGEEWYESSVDKDGTIVNELKGKTNYTIDKLWAQLDSEGNVVIDEKGKTVYGKTAPMGASISVKLLQNNKDFVNNTFTLDGTLDVFELEPFSAYINDLPKFDESGAKYNYFAVESSKWSTWKATYEYDVSEKDGTHWDAQIKNDPNGEGEQIKIMKQWFDDGDEQHRHNVVIEVYAKGENNSLDELIGQVTLTAKKNWWDYFGIPQKYEGREFYIKEKGMIDDDGKLVEVTKSKVPGTTREKDVVQLREHVYEVSYEPMVSTDDFYVVKNRRIGIVNVTATKKWIDAGANVNDRPKATLHLSIVESGYENAIDTTNNTITLTPNDSLPILDADGNKTTAIQTVTNDNNQEYNYYNLPKYDGNGKIIHYKITEKADNDEEFKTKHYVSSIRDEAYTVGEKHAADTQTLSVVNKRQATKEIYFEKEWRDTYVYESGKRPDIYLTLWSKDSINEDPNEMEKYLDRTWSGIEHENAEYFWRCNFGYLPMYDEQGGEITYYATENMSVDRKAFDYTPVTLDDAHRVYLDKDGSITTSKTNTEILKESGRFTNVIENNVVVQGKKIWKNVPSGFPNAELPPLNIIVSRSLQGSDYVDIASTESLEGSGKELAFSVAYEGENKIENGITKPVNPTASKLPKYNENGALYNYKVSEKISDNWQTEDTKPDETTYEKLPGEVNDYIITNAYNLGEENMGKLTVKKVWDMKNVADATVKYPVLSFTLQSCYKQNADGKDSAWEDVSTKTLVTPDTETEATLTFDNVSIFAPNGNYYKYRIIEKKIDGYTTQVTVNNGNSEVTFTSVDENTKSQTTSDKIQNAVEKDDVVDVTFKNTYNNPKEMVKLSGNKKWTDFANAYQIRPDEITLKLYRYANAQSGNNGIGSEVTPDVKFNTSAKHTITLTPTDKEAETWSYEVEGLERYAPNGMPWIYIVKEEVAENGTSLAHYDIDQKSDKVIIAKQNKVATNGDITMNDIMNTSKKSAKVVKTWSGSLDEYHLRPSSIHVKLQVKDSSNTWRDATDALKVNNTLPAGVNVADKKVELKNGKWEATYANLPVGNSAGSFSYRIIETAFNDKDGNPIKDVELATSTVEKPDVPVYKETWIYQPTSTITIVNGSGKVDTTKIDNELVEADTISLVVNKTWANDQENVFQTRPVSSDKTKWEVKVKLQRSTDGATFVDALDVDGKEIIRSITGKLNEAITSSYTFAKLPKFDAQGNTLQYRAVEVTDTAGKLGTYTIAVTHTGDNPYTTNITNTMDTVTLAVTKNWEGEAVGFESLRPENLSLKLFATPEKGTIKEVTSMYKPSVTWIKDTKAWTYTYTNLPKRDIDGKVFTYSVTEATQKGYEKAVITKTERVDASKDDAFKTSITNVMTKFALEKTDQSNNSLDGYTFEIYDGTTKVANWTSSNGVVTANTYKDANPIPSPDSYIYGLTVGVQYTLKETIAPTGYVLAKDINFKIKEDGTLVFDGGTPTYASIKGTATIGSTLVVKDARTSFKINKVAVDFDQNTTNLQGAELTIYDDLGQVAKTIDGTELSWISDGNPKEITGLPVGQYTLKETSTPTSYVTAKDTKFKVLANGEIEKVEGEDTIFGDDKKSLTVQDYVIQGKVTLTKNDERNKALPYIEFMLYREDGTFVEEYKTDTAGKIPLILPYGKYYFVEKQTQDNLIIDKTKIPFTIDGVNENNIISQPTQDISLSMINKDFKTYISLTKTDNLDVAKVLAGIEFTLSKKNKDGTWSAIDTFTTDENGKIESILINTKGTYQIKETESIYGYVFRGDEAYTAEFTVENTNDFHNKTLVLSDTPSLEDIKLYSLTVDHKVNSDEEHVTNERIQANIKLTKTSSNGPLKGVEFELYKANGSTKVLEKENLVTDKDGELLIEDLEVGTYFFKEISTHADKVLNSNYYPTDGIVIDQEKQHSTIQVEMENEDFESYVTLVKKDSADNSLLKGVEFTLYRQDGSEYKPYGTPVLSDEKGEVNITIHHKGHYRIVETSTVSGYVLDQENLPTVEFDISESMHKVTLDLNTFLNTKTHVDILKVNQENIALSGAEFKLTGDFADGSKEVTWISTGQAYVLDGLLIAGKTYTLAETKAPQGYELMKPVTLVMNAHGYLESVNEAAEIIKDSNGSILVENTPIELGLMKTDVDGNKLASGYEFSVKGIFANATIESTIKIDANNPTALNAMLVAGNTYELSETKTPNGYKLGGTVTFTVKEDGDITLTSSNEYARVSDINGIHISMKDEVTSIKIKKVSEENSVLPGVDFKLTGTFVNPETKEITWTSGKEAFEISNQLIAGNNYILTEVKAADGYVLPKDSITIQIDANGNLKDYANNEIVITNKPIELELEKRDGDKVLTGYEFSVSGTFANTKEQVIVVDEAHPDALKGKLIASYDETKPILYTIRETKAPDGYEIGGEASFTIKPDGTIVLAENVEGYHLEKDTITNMATIVMNDTMTSIQLLKSNEAQTPLIGATFTLTGKFANPVATEIKWISGEDATSLEGRLINGETYTLTETKAPNGYQKLANPVIFKLDSKGKIDKDSVSEPAVLESNQIRITNTAIALPVKKVDVTTNTNLTGYEFKVEGNFADDTVDEIIVNESNPDALYAQLIVNEQYTIRETKTPKGYKLGGETTFTVNEDGSITLVETEEFTMEEGTLVMKDTQTSTSIQKVDANGNLIANATFTLTGNFAITQEASIQWTSTTDPIEFVGELIAGETYELTETKAADGHILLTDKIILTMDTNGELIQVSEPAILSNNVVTVKNLPIELAIEKIGVDTNLMLSGYEFHVVGEFAQARYENESNIDDTTILVDEAHPDALKGRLISGKTYTIKEVATPHGYKLGGETTFTVDANGSITLKETSEYTLHKDDETGKFTIVMKDEPTNIDILKVDADGNALANATFTLTGKFAYATQESISWTGDETPYAIIKELIANETYILHEDSAPDGHLKLTKDITIVMDEVGNIKSVDNATWKDNSIQVSNNPIEVTLGKVDVHTNDVLTGYEFKVSGTFAPALYNEANEDEAGNVILDEVHPDALKGRLIAGNTYTLSETKTPDGYKLGGSVTFVVDDAGNVTLGETSEYTTHKEDETGVVQIIMGDEPTSLTVHKKDDVGHALTGAQFILRGVFADREDSSILLHDDEVSSFVITGALIVGETNTLEEVKAPEGYQRIIEPITIQIDAQGNIAHVDGADVQGNEITIDNTPIQVHLAKEDEEGTSLTGYEFHVIGEFAQARYENESNIDETTILVDEAHPDALKGRLISGNTYTIKEVKAPIGYQIGEEAIFMIDSDGNIILEESSVYSLRKEDQVHLISMMDAPTHLKVLKVDEAGNVLEGTKFTLSGKFANTTETSITWTSGNEAFTIKNELIANETYTLVEEKATNGYTRIAEAMIIQVDSTGRVISVSGNATTLEDNTLRIMNLPIELKISKHGTDTNELLLGCVFNVTGIFASIQDESGNQETAETTIVVDDEHPDALTGRLIAGNTYVLKEVISPNGYEVGGETKFTVLEDGSINLEESSEYAYVFDKETNSYEIVMVDTPIEFKIVKTDEAGQPLANAEFMIEGIFADGSQMQEARSFTSDARGEINLNKQLNESDEGIRYTIKETTAPEGFETLANDFKIQVMRGGVVKLDEASIDQDAITAVSITEEDGVYILTIKNKKTPEATGPNGSNTGDTTNPVLYMGMFAVSGGALVIVSKKRRKKATK